MAQFVNGPEANVPDDLDILRDEETPEEETPKEEPEDKEESPESEEEETPEEEEETPEEEEEESEEKEEDETKEDEPDPNEKVGAPFANRPTYRELNAKYPKLFKDFPGLRDTFFREKEFSQRFPDIESADEMIEQFTILKEGEQRISTGNPDEFLTMLRDFGKPEVERRFISNFLPALYRSNRAAFAAITQPVLKNVLRGAMAAGKQHGNENLQNSALHLHEFVFGDIDIEKGVPNPAQETSTQKSQEQVEFERERANFLQTRHQEFQEHVLDRGSRGINKVIEESFQEGMSNLEKKAFGDEVRTRLASVLKQDTQHLALMKRIQGQAEKAGFSKEFKDRAASAYLSRAKVALPAIIKEVRSEYLKDKGKTPSPIKRPSATGNRPPANRNVQRDKSKEELVKSGKMSEKDFLMSD